MTLAWVSFIHSLCAHRDAPLLQKHCPSITVLRIDSLTGNWNHSFCRNTSMVFFFKVRRSSLIFFFGKAHTICSFYATSSQSNRQPDSLVLRLPRLLSSCDRSICQVFWTRQNTTHNILSLNAATSCSSDILPSGENQGLLNVFLNSIFSITFHCFQ